MSRRFLIFLAIFTVFIFSKDLHAVERDILFVGSEDSTRGSFSERQVFNIYSLDPETVDLKIAVKDAIYPVRSNNSKMLAYVKISGKEGRIKNVEILGPSKRQVRAITKFDAPTEILDIGWSPDDKRLAISVQNQLFVSTPDGDRKIIYNGTKQILSVDWLDDSKTVVFWEPPYGTKTINADTGEMSILFRPGYGFPGILKGRDEVVFLRKRGFDYELVLMELESKVERSLDDKVKLSGFKNTLLVSGDGSRVFYRDTSDNLCLYDVYKGYVTRYREFDGDLVGISSKGEDVIGAFPYGVGERALYGTFNLKRNETSLFKGAWIPGEKPALTAGATKLVDW